MMARRKSVCVFYCLLFLCLSFNAFANISWTNPLTLSSGSLDASDPKIVLDPQGNATAVWIENGSVKACKYSVDEGWGSSATVSIDPGAASNPQLGIDAEGNATAIWIQGGVINAAILSGGIWSPPLPISNVLGDASSPALAVDANGNAVAAWVSSNAIQTSTRTLGIWSVAAAISGSASDFPQVAISANGTVIAVWHRFVSGADVIVSCTKTLSGNWGTAKNVFNATAALKHNYPKVAIDAHGNAVLAWFRYNYSGGAYQNVVILASVLTYNASAWTIPSILSRQGLRDPADLILKTACDPQGDAIAFWTNSYDGQLFSVESAEKPYGGNWSDSAMPDYPCLYALSGDIDVNSLGGILATYMTVDNNQLIIQVQESCIASSLSNVWIGKASISQGNQNAYPRCATALAGNTLHAAAVWVGFNGICSVVNASIGLGEIIQPPISLYVVQHQTDFGVYTDFYNTITWQASPAPNIIQYNIYRNGVFCGTASPSSLQFIDHNARENEPVTYGIATLDSHFRQSAIATITFP